MRTRDLKPAEWRRYFDSFSRHFRDRRVTMAMNRPTNGLHFLAQQLPLMGVVVDQDNEVRTIEFLIGNVIDGQINHVIHDPRRVRIAQVSNGSDEIVLVRSRDHETTLLDFSERGVLRGVMKRHAAIASHEPGTA